MNRAEYQRDAEISKLGDVELLRKLVGDDTDDISIAERKAFAEMLQGLYEGRAKLSKRQRSWAEEAMRRVTPVRAEDVPRGKEVVTPEALRRENLPLKPPGLKKEPT